MRRRLFNLAAALSLVLCGVTVLWMRGRLTWKYDQVAFNCGIRDDGGQTSLRAINTPFGIEVLACGRTRWH